MDVINPVREAPEPCRLLVPGRELCKYCRMVCIVMSHLGIRVLVDGSPVCVRDGFLSRAMSRVGSMPKIRPQPLR